MNEGVAKRRGRPKIPEGCQASIPRTAVYMVRCQVAEKVYVGASTNVYNRICGHKARLRRNKHQVPEMQRDWNQYGEEAFVFDVIQYVADARTARVAEDELIKSMAASGKLYNLKTGAVPKPKPKRKTFNWSGEKKRFWNFSVDESLLDWFRTAAKERGVSVNYYLRELITEERDRVNASSPRTSHGRQPPDGHRAEYK